MLTTYQRTRTTATVWSPGHMITGHLIAAAVRLFSGCGSSSGSWAMDRFHVTVWVCSVWSVFGSCDHLGVACCTATGRWILEHDSLCLSLNISCSFSWERFWLRRTCRSSATLRSCCSFDSRLRTTQKCQSVRCSTKRQDEELRNLLNKSLAVVDPHPQVLVLLQNVDQLVLQRQVLLHLRRNNREEVLFLGTDMAAGKVLVTRASMFCSFLFCSCRRSFFISMTNNNDSCSDSQNAPGLPWAWRAGQREEHRLRSRSEEASSKKRF